MLKLVFIDGTLHIPTLFCKFCDLYQLEKMHLQASEPDNGLWSVINSIQRVICHAWRVRLDKQKIMFDFNFTLWNIFG